MQIRQKIFKWSIMQVQRFFPEHSETFDISHPFLPLIVAKLSTLKQVRFFVPSCSN